ncbi:MAG: bifunctional diguanylate cyclase/phosphodiesterase, partial [Usitatibacter sp.]
FNKVNDALGRAAGDEILRQVADRMRAASGDDSRLARINADRFAAVSLQAETGEQLARLVETRMIQVFEAPFQIGDRPVAVSAHMGIAVFPDDGRSAEALMRNSEAAAAKAKVVGEPYLFYSEAMNARIAEQLALEGRLREALAKEEFVLHYQPKVDVLTREVVGLEALIRWQSAGRLVPPMDFIPLLEEAGLILQVGEWAQAQAARDHRALASAGLAPPRIAVNVSAQQLRQRDFVAVVERAATDGGKLAGVDLELTESQLMSDIEGSIVKLAALRKLGVNIAIDDFGTGYSSLAHLAKLPVQSLKIDRSFIAAMDRDSGAKPLIIAIISLAHSLRLKVCAEGVETEAQAQFLALQDCDEMQGYLVSKPLPYEALLEFLRRDADHVRSRTDVATVQAERWSP